MALRRADTNRRAKHLFFTVFPFKIIHSYTLIYKYTHLFFIINGVDTKYFYNVDK